MFEAKEFTGKTLLGIDYGEKVIGLAIYKYKVDPFPLLHGRIVVPRSKNIYEDLKNIIEEDFVDIIILGLPHLTDGKATAMTQKVKAFGEDLRSRFPNCPLHYQDETLSTYEAEERMKNDPRFDFKINLEKIDEVSACIIIEQFLSEKVKRESP
ncbi:MAG: Holliday junction resolvase RuvX [Halobacteriovoraceae bacterium]|nr:Holliday junction resolvase RuvX [Halobacteriovoraceae bacterium]